MQTWASRLNPIAVVLVLLAAQRVQGTTVLPLNLDELSARAGGIFRGRVVEVRTGTVEAGGGTLATTIYRLEVDEAFKGRFPDHAKTGAPVVEIQMVAGPAKPSKSPGPIRTLPLSLDLPRLQVGREYLLFTTAPSRVGLSTTVGLAQGCFRVYRSPGREPVAVNALDNQGLFRGMKTSLTARGPLPYAELAREVRAALARRGGTS